MQYIYYLFIYYSPSLIWTAGSPFVHSTIILDRLVTTPFSCLSCHGSESGSDISFFLLPPSRQIGPTSSGNIEAPLWSYKLGLDNGWVSKDPRDSVGRCKDLGVPNDGFNGQYQGHATGSGGGTIPPSVIASWPWPPVSISNAPVPVAQLPMYTPTGTIVTLPPPSHTGKVKGVDGWANSQDTAPAPTPISGCVYPDAYSTSGVVPLSGCSTGGGSSPTPAP